jgi:hypothetical protein
VAFNAGLLQQQTVFSGNDRLGKARKQERKHQRSSPCAHCSWLKIHRGRYEHHQHNSRDGEHQHFEQPAIHSAITDILMPQSGALLQHMGSDLLESSRLQRLSIGERRDSTSPLYPHRFRRWSLPGLVLVEMRQRARGMKLRRRSERR